MFILRPKTPKSLKSPLSTVASGNEGNGLYVLVWYDLDLVHMWCYFRPLDTALSATVPAKQNLTMLVVVYKRHWNKIHNQCLRVKYLLRTVRSIYILMVTLAFNGILVITVMEICNNANNIRIHEGGFTIKKDLSSYFVS